VVTIEPIVVGEAGSYGSRVMLARAKTRRSEKRHKKSAPSSAIDKKHFTPICAIRQGYARYGSGAAKKRG
jgi:hypothetical protein